MSGFIYKICSEPLWRAAEAAGVFEGSPADLRDGYIHLSAADQVRATAARHFAGEDRLLLIAVDPDALGDRLRWERSSGGALFPHLYSGLPLSAVRTVVALPRDGATSHVFPADIP